MELVKTRRLAAMHPPSPAASAFAEATVDESEDRKASARKGGDEADDNAQKWLLVTTTGLCEMRW